MKLKIICFASMFLALMTGSVYATGSKITENIANVHISDTSVQIIDQLKKGTAINVLDSNGRLLKISYGNNLEGWIDASCVKDKFPVTTALNWIEIPGAQETGVSQGTQLGGNNTSSTYKIGDYEKRQMLVELAESKVGSGRTEPEWSDEWENNYYTCNGFITWLYLHIYDEERGRPVQMPHNGIYQADFVLKSAMGTIYKVQQHIKNGGDIDDVLAPGDVLYQYGDGNPNAAGHVALYVGDGMIIHATGDRGEQGSLRKDNLLENDNKGRQRLGLFFVYCRIIDNGKINTKDPGTKVRSLRRIPDNIQEKLGFSYDYEELEKQGVKIVESDASDNVI